MEIKLLHQAVKQQKYKVVSDLLKDGNLSPDSLLGNDTLITPLFYAIQSNDVRMANILLEKGADVCHLNKWHETPLSEVLDENHPKNSDSHPKNHLNFSDLLKRYRPVTSLQSGFENPKEFFGKDDMFVIRCIQPSDNEAVKEVYSQSYSEYTEKYSHIREWMIKTYTQDMKNPYQWYGSGVRPKTAFWVIENRVSGTLAGTIAVVPVPSRIKPYEVAEVQRFSIHPDFQRLGLGTYLIRHVEKWASSQGFKSLFLRTLPELEKAVQFYQKNGFIRDTSNKSFKTINFVKSLKTQENFEELELYDPRRSPKSQNSLPFYEVTPEKGRVYFTHNFVKNNTEKVKKILKEKSLPFPFKRDFTTFPTLQDYFLELCRLNTKNYKKEKYELDYYIEEEPGTLARVSNNGSPEIRSLTTEELVSPLIIPFNKEFNEKGNALTDYFNEGARVECIYDEEGKTLLELYKEPEIKGKIIDKAIGKYKEISDFSLRRSMYGIITGCNLFKPQLAKAIYDLFEPTKVLDMCSGWGDRLLGAMACETIEEYQGFDPNTKLIPGYKNMIQSFEGVVKGTYSIESIPFENSHLKNEYYDLAFTSPPFFDVEVYTDEKTQSVELNPDLILNPSGSTLRLNLWIDTWLYPMMEKAWKALKFGGHLALYINDSQDKLNTSVKSGDSQKTIPKAGAKALCQRMMKHSTKLPNNIFVGVIGVESQTPGKHRLLWVWRKE